MKKTKRCLVFLCLLLVFVSLVQPVSAKKFNKKEAKKKITVTYKKTTNGILAVYKNKNNQNIELTATMHFLASNKKDITKETRINYCLGAKTTATLFFSGPLDEYGNYIVYDSYKASFSVAKSKHKSYAKKIKVTSELKTVEGSFTAVNLSGKTLSNIDATIVFYDGSDNIIGCKTKYLNCFAPNAMDQFTVDYVQNAGMPNRAKVFINAAY